jgi:hypothetical protein
LPRSLRCQAPLNRKSSSLSATGLHSRTTPSHIRFRVHIRTRSHIHTQALFTAVGFYPGYGYPTSDYGYYNGYHGGGYGYSNGYYDGGYYSPY